MTTTRAGNVLEVLAWLKTKPPAGFVSLEEAATQFGLEPEQMRRNLQWLQRYECVRRGGQGNAEWSITALGRVRLAEGRFSPNGGFLSPYEHASKTPKVVEDVSRRPTDVTAANTERETLERWTESTLTD